MIDIVLTHSYHLQFDAKQSRKMQPYRPLGTLYAASALQRSGINVAIFDTMLRDPEEFGAFLKETRARMVAIYEDDFNFVTKMCLSRMREVVWSIAEDARSAGIPVLVHGSDASDHQELFLSHGIDYLLKGEAENALVQVCQSVIAGRPPGQIAGLVRRADDGTSLPSLSAPSLNPGWVHDPAPSLLLTDFAPYREAWSAAHGYFSVNMVASRGCPFRCNWCAKPISGNRFQLRAAAAVAEEMHQLKTVVGAEHIWFSDDVFALNHHWIVEFAQEVTARDAALPLKVQSRADLLTDATVAAMKTAGCTEVWMGVESGSQKVLDLMDKGLTLAQVRSARRRLQDAGIRACYFLQLGYPGEQWKDLEQTIALVRETRPDDVGISFSYPLPGTPFYKSVQTQLGSKRNWSESDDLCILFHGEYTTTFYQAVREALHAEVDSWRDPSASLASQVDQLWSQVHMLEVSSRTPRMQAAATRPDPKSTNLVSLHPLSSTVGA